MDIIFGQFVHPVGGEGVDFELNVNVREGGDNCL